MARHADLARHAGDDLVVALPGGRSVAESPEPRCRRDRTASRTCRRRRRGPHRDEPDLSGIYTPSYRYFQNLAADIGLENVPMTDEARKIHAARATGLLGYEEPDAHCLPQGVPKINMAPVPFKIVQTDKLVVLVYEAFNLWRQVFLDGREWADDLNPSWMGYSKGRWEGDTLVVETRGPERQAVARSRRSAGERQADSDRAIPPPERRAAGDRAHHQRPDLLHQAVDGDHQRSSDAGHRALRVHLQREREVHGRTWARTSSTSLAPGSRLAAVRALPDARRQERLALGRQVLVRRRSSSYQQ